MGSYEIIVKTEEIKRKVREGDYASALRILDTINYKKVKKLPVLSLMAEVFTQNGRYEEALSLLLRIYHKSNSRKVLYQLIWLSIQLNNIGDAESFLSEYANQVPRDYNIYILRYQIDKLKGESFETQIRTLEALKEAEYIEQWAYELAKLYYKAGMEEECIRECSDIILWFGEGSYVEKARVLRAYYSGEADKDMIIEQLKKRAKQDYIGSDMATPPEYEEKATTMEMDREEDIRIEFPLEEGYDDFTNQMKRGVEKILAEEETINQSTDRDYSIEYHYTGETPGDEYLEKEIPEIREEEYPEKEVSEIEEEEYPEKEVSETGEEEYPEEDAFKSPKELLTATLSEREIAEQEVEDELYRLLEEEDDEDSQKLNRISADTGIDLYDVFGNFLHVKAVRKQLAKSLDMILDKHTKSVQMIITGIPGSGKTDLAKAIALFLHMTGKLKTSKVAKTSAVNLNTTDITSKKDSLRNCCLVIENASELKRPTIDKLLELIRLYHGEIGVIFLENKKNMNKLFRECPKLMDMFKNRIHLPQYTEEELLGFSYSYLKRKEYRLHNGAQTVLKTFVNLIARKKAPEQQLDEIQKLVQSAMDSADIRMGRELTSLAAQGRLGEIGFLSLLPEDFNYKP